MNNTSRPGSENGASHDVGSTLPAGKPDDDSAWREIGKWTRKSGEGDLTTEEFTVTSNTWMLWWHSTVASPRGEVNSEVEIAVYRKGGKLVEVSRKSKLPLLLLRTGPGEFYLVIYPLSRDCTVIASESID